MPQSQPRPYRNEAGALQCVLMMLLGGVVAGVLLIAGAGWWSLAAIPTGFALYVGLALRRDGWC